MALVDFYQLAVLHKLSRCNAGSPTHLSHTGSMPTDTQMSSRSPSIEQDQPGTSFPLPTQPEPKTPKRNRNATQSDLRMTPAALGTPAMRQLMHPMVQPPKLKSSRYEEYIVQDFECHRVFIDIDVFMKNVLHVPDDWRELWKKSIEDIKHDQAFISPHMFYGAECAIPGGQEPGFYKHLVDMSNAILDFSAKDSSDESVRLRTPQRYLRNDPKTVSYGIITDLSPDIVAIHKEFLAGGGSRSNLSWAQPLQACEVKPRDGALVDGLCMPGLVVNGKDPRENHIFAPVPSRFSGEAAIPEPTVLTADQEASSRLSAPPRPNLKRAAEEPADHGKKVQKVRPQSAPTGGATKEKKKWRLETAETEYQKSAYLQVGRHLLNQFSVPAFRSHATIALVDRDRIQFYHANHSVILVSSAISFSTTDTKDGLDKFIAIVIAFGRLTLCDNGIPHNLEDGKLFNHNERLVTGRVSQGTVEMQDGNEMAFGGDEKTGPFTLRLGEVISHDPSLAGRSTAVLQGKSKRWKTTNLVVKISWPSSERKVEQEFLHRATLTAGGNPKDKWALKHLPKVLYAQDVVFGPDSTHEKVARLFDGAEIINGKYKYERRTLRIIIQERLHPLENLTEVKNVAQVLLDAACVHRWLYDRVGILHRDLSPNNIMYRIVNNKVYGVLTDYDLASWTESLTSDYTKTSQQRTGTPPFMAFGLLDGTDALHLYRHDVESLFYVMLITATHYEIQPRRTGEAGGMRMRQGELPFELWFDEPSYEKIAIFKKCFLWDLKYLDLSPTFEDFRGWLVKLQISFNRGLLCAMQHKSDEDSMDSCDEGAPAPFDEETLGGYVDYSALIDPARHLKGKLKGLVIRYRPQLPPLQTPTGTAQAGL